MTEMVGINEQMSRLTAENERLRAELTQLRKIVALHQQDGCGVALAATAKALGGDPPPEARWQPPIGGGSS